MNDKSEIIGKVAEGFVNALLFSSCNEEGDYYDDLGVEASSQLKEEAHHLCGLFYDENEKDCTLFAQQYQPSQGHDVWECLGHDLWLTSAGHGVGFWDRGLGELGERLTAACSYVRPYAHREIYLGDDDLIYLA